MGAPAPHASSCDVSSQSVAAGGGGGSMSKRRQKRETAKILLPPTVGTMPGICKVEGCDQPTDSHGYCGKHAQRFRRYGDPLHITTEAQRRANNRAAQLARFEQVKETTYRKRHGRHEHRIVAEQMLGRPLQPGEIVHHIDGNKHNNDPSNLQVMTQGEHIQEHLLNGDGLHEWQGQRLTINQLADAFQLPRRVIYARLRAGWTLQRIFNSPVRKWERRDG
jgi:hypothetical protein